jgi:hypothetical protein
VLDPDGQSFSTVFDNNHFPYVLLLDAATMKIRYQAAGAFTTTQAFEAAIAKWK